MNTKGSYHSNALILEILGILLESVPIQKKRIVMNTKLKTLNNKKREKMETKQKKN